MAWFALQSNYKDKGALCRLQTAKYISGSTAAGKEIIPIPDPVSCFDTVDSRNSYVSGQRDYYIVGPHCAKVSLFNGWLDWNTVTKSPYRRFGISLGHR